VDNAVNGERLAMVRQPQNGKEEKNERITDYQHRHPLPSHQSSPAAFVPIANRCRFTSRQSLIAIRRRFPSWLLFCRG
jgi:hypothetical protein